MKKINLISCFLFFAFSGLRGQSADVMENQYRALGLSIVKEQAALDSLHLLIENTAQDIEREKKAADPDEKKLVSWMAHAVTISHQIKEKQKSVSVIEAAAEEARVRLEKFYTQIIDSLKQIGNSRSYSGDRESLQNMILMWTEKRVLISPVVNVLNFDPAKVREIDLKSTVDPLERSLAEDYLKKALNEIDARLGRLSATRQEYEELTDLRRRTADFVSEAYEQGRLSTITRSQTVTKTVTDILGNPIGTEFTTIQVKSVVGLIHQLSAGTAPISSKSGMTQTEYIQLLKQAEKQLKSYRELVQKKLK